MTGRVINEHDLPRVAQVDEGSAAAVWGGLFPWIVWAVATILALTATSIYGRWLPWSDDFDIVPYVTGDRPVTATWLWKQHNEHRIPLVKLVFVVLGRLSGADHRWTLAANAVFLSLTAAALVVAARRVRGKTVWTDALFPAVLLHLGQGALVWSFQTPFVLTTVLGGLFVATAVAAPPGVWRVAVMGACAGLLPLTGTGGLVVAAAAAALLGAEALGWNAPPAGRSPLVRSLAAAASGLTVIVAFAYVVTLRLMPAENYAGPWRTLIAGLDAFSSYPGSLVTRSRTAWLVATVLVGGGTALAAAAAARARDATLRHRLAILLLHLAALGLMALAIGYGRGTRDFSHLYGHYATLTLGVPLSLGLIWATLPQTRAARAMQAVLCIVAVTVAVVHARQAVRNWRSGDESVAVIATDMRGSLPPDEVAARHAAALYFIDTPDIRRKIAEGIALLRRTSYPLYCTRTSPPAPTQP
ncbi:MAG: hypothetical protein ACKOCX_10875 [Planctomycetota bacterium]